MFLHSLASLFYHLIRSCKDVLFASVRLYFLSTLSRSKNQPGLISIDFCCAGGFMILQYTWIFSYFIVVLNFGIHQAMKIWELLPEHWRYSYILLQACRGFGSFISRPTLFRDLAPTSPLGYPFTNTSILPITQQVQLIISRFPL